MGTMEEPAGQQLAAAVAVEPVLWAAMLPELIPEAMVELDASTHNSQEWLAVLPDGLPAVEAEAEVLLAELAVMVEEAMVVLIQELQELQILEEAVEE